MRERLVSRRLADRQVLAQRGDELVRLDLVEGQHREEARHLCGAFDVLGRGVLGAERGDVLVCRRDHGRVVISDVRLQVGQPFHVGGDHIDDVLRFLGHLGAHRVRLVLESVLALDMVEGTSLEAIVHDALDAVEAVGVGHA